MTIPQRIHTAVAVFLFSACNSSMPELPPAPVAKVVPFEIKRHGHVRVDDYYWLRQREKPEVAAYLKAENAYLATVMKHTEPLQEKLYEEIVGRIRQDDDSVPYLKDGYYYYERVVEGGEYPLRCRKKGSIEADEEVLLDGNALAAGHDYFRLRGLEVSPDGDILAYAVDTVGRNFYTIRFKDLTSGELLPDVITDITANLVWANDSRTVFYARQHPETLRSYRIYRHNLGNDPASDEVVFEEEDETRRTFVFKTRSRQYVLIVSFHILAHAETRYLDADDPAGAFRVLEPRAPGLDYTVAHHGDHFYLRTNHQAENYRLARTPTTATGIENWQEVLPHRSDVLLTDFELFRNYLVVAERRDGLSHMRIHPLAGGEEHDLDFGESAFLAFPIDNYDFDAQVLRYRYSSMTTPFSTFDYDMETREKVLRKQQEVVGGFDAASYETERLMAPARDGKAIPVSLVYKKDLARDGSRPLLMTGYGTYGATYDPTFDPARLSLLDRGFIFAIAHIRGGQALGREWYEDGKLLKKKNSFYDFIDVAEYLVAEGYTANDRLFAQGTSAGGLLVGAVVTLRPDLVHGVIAQVPFLDVLTTMLDADIPSTPGEWAEWGDPREKEYYDYLLSYSPYDNLKATDYPHLLVTTGFHDSQVQYWDPAKWVAKARALKTDDNRLLLHTNMEAGHGGASGRFERHRETALAYAFLLDLAGIKN